MLKVTLKRSTVKATKRQQETVRGLGLRKLNHTRIVPDNPAIRGMIVKVNHLIDWEEVTESS